MRNGQVRLSLLVAASIGLVAAFAAGPVFGQAAQKYKEQISQYSSKLDELAEQDKWGSTTEDRKRARQVLEEARKLLAQGDADTAGWLVKQAGDRVKLVEVKVKAAKLKNETDDQRKTYQKQTEETIPKLESQIEELKNQKESLEEEIDELE